MSCTFLIIMLSSERVAHTMTINFSQVDQGIEATSPTTPKRKGKRAAPPGQGQASSSKKVKTPGKGKAADADGDNDKHDSIEGLSARV